MIHGFWARLFSPQAPGKFAAPRHEAPALEASYIEHLMGLIGCLGLLKFLGFQPVVASDGQKVGCVRFASAKAVELAMGKSSHGWIAVGDKQL